MQSINPSLESDLPPPQATVATANYEWILSPQLDILFACGGMMWIFWIVVDKLGIVSSLDNAPGTVVWLSWLISIHIFSNAHAFLGWHRVATSPYVQPQVRKKLGYFAIFLTAMLFPAVLVPGLAILLAKIYVFWLFQHFVAQAYGVTMLYCLKRKYSMSKREKDIMHWMFRLLTCMIITRALTFEEFSGRELFEAKLPFWGPLPTFVYQLSVFAFIGAVVLFAGMVVRKYVQQKLLFPLPALLVTVSVIALFVLTVSSKEPKLGLIMSGFYHGSQNFVIATACHLKERGLPTNLPTSKISSMLLRPYTITYFCGIVAAGILLFVVLPHALTLLSAPIQICIAAVFALQGFHHFVTEAVVWRMRHPDVRNILIA